MLGRKKLTRKRASETKDLALELADDEKFRKQLLSAVKHAGVARGRTRDQLGLGGTLRRLAADEQLRRELREARDDLRRAYARAEKKNRSHKLRNLTLVAGLASLAGIPQLRQRLVAAATDAWAAGRRTASAGARTATPSRPQNLEELTKEELYERAQRADIPGRSDMTKDELVQALRASR